MYYSICKQPCVVQPGTDQLNTDVQKENKRTKRKKEDEKEEEKSEGKEGKDLGRKKEMLLIMQLIKLESSKNAIT